MIVQGAGDLSRESVAVHRQCTAGRHCMTVGGSKHKRVQTAHFFLQYSYCITQSVSPQ
ncbi:hypothetical protein D3C86_1900540 [compost metagenome]